jgi:DNA-binding NtrC family response regulator
MVNSMAKARLTILYGEGDEDVLKTQASALESAGYSVQQVLGRKGTIEALKKAKFDLVVLGATLTRNDRHHLPYMAKKANAETKILVLHADGTRHPYVDGCVDTGASIDNVLAKIQSMSLAAAPIAAGAAAGR